MTPNMTRAYAILLAMPLFFSTNLVIGRAAVDVAGPWSLAFFRWSIALAIVLVLVWGRFRSALPALMRHWRSLLVLGFLGMWICGGIVYLGVERTTATNATLIYTASPVIVVLLEWIFRGRRTTVWQALGIALGIAGVTAIVIKGDLAALMALRFNPGDLMIAFAATAWAVYSVLLKRDDLQVFDTFVLFAAIMVAGVAVLAPMMVWEVTGPRGLPLTAEAWLVFAALGVIPGFLAYSSYQYGVKVVGPAVTSVFLYLLPIYGVGLAVAFLGEPLRAYHALGFVMVMVGVVLATAPSGALRRLRSA